MTFAAAGVYLPTLTAGTFSEWVRMFDSAQPLKAVIGVAA
jgi:hypothetical protein